MILFIRNNYTIISALKQDKNEIICDKFLPYFLWILRSKTGTSFMTLYFKRHRRA